MKYVNLGSKEPCVTDSILCDFQCPGRYGNPLQVSVQPCLLPQVDARLESFKIEVSESIYDPTWHQVAYAVSSSESTRQSPDSAPLFSIGDLMPVTASSPYDPSACEYQFIRVPAFNISKVTCE